MYGSTSTPSLTSDTLESNSSNSNNSSDTQSFTKSQIEDLEKSLEFFPRNHEEDEFDYVTSPTIVRFNYKQRLMKCFLRYVPVGFYFEKLNCMNLLLNFFHVLYSFQFIGF